MQAREQDSQENDRDSGTNSRESFASFDPVSSSWRTSQRCLVEGWTPYSEPWPRSGTMRSGRACELPTWAQRIDGIGCSSSRGEQVWPTAAAMDGSSVSLNQTPEGWMEESEKHRAKGQHKQYTLQVSATLGMSEPQVTRARRGENASAWMTPTREGFDAGKHRGKADTLHSQIKSVTAWPTASATDYKGSSKPGQRRGQLSEAANWPTPDASVANDTEELESWLARRERVKATAQNGNGMGTPLAVAVRLWPTTTAGDARSSGSRSSETSDAHDGTSLTDATVRAAPTKGLKLNPAWVSQLMGFDRDWTLLAPASPSTPGKRPVSSRTRKTAPRASKPSATPSFRKSRK